MQNKEKESITEIIAINLIKRTNDNNTHDDKIDEQIKKITCWKIDKTKFRRAIVFYILSFGIIYIIALISLRVYLYLNCVPNIPREADFFVIVDSNDNWHYVKAIKETYYKINKYLQNFSSEKTRNLNYFRSSPKKQNRLSADSHLVSQKYLHKDKEMSNRGQIVFHFRRNRYVYIESRNVFTPVAWNITEYNNKDLHELFSDGIKTYEDYNYLLNKYGKNHLRLKNKILIKKFVKDLFHPVHLYQIYCLVFWSYTKYHLWIYVVILNCVLVLILVLMKFRNHRQIQNYILGGNSKNKFRTIRKFHGCNDKLANDIEYLVPGDIITLKPGDIVPADCVLINGRCNLDESDLTGIRTSMSKSELSKDFRKFSFDYDKISILHQGSLITSLIDKRDEGVTALVFNTGLNTYRSSLMGLSCVRTKKSNFDYFFYFKYYFFVVIILFLGFLILTLGYFKNICNYNYQQILGECDNNRLKNLILTHLSFILHPALTLTTTFTSIYFGYHLAKTRALFFQDEKCIYAAGQVNTVVFDKTGTLTEEKNELHGFQGVVLNLNTNHNTDNSQQKFQINYKKSPSPSTGCSKMEFDNIETDLSVYNDYYLEFWKQTLRTNKLYDDLIENYQTNPEYSLIYFLECLACCHSMDLNKNGFNAISNTIDQTIYNSHKWKLEKSDEGLYDMIPKNSYKITEDLKFNKIINQKDTHIRVENMINNRSFKLTVLKRSKFASNSQMMNVIVKNSLDGSLRLFVKGAPEKIIEMCIESSIPVNFEEVLLSGIKNGHRAIACATKLLSKYPQTLTNNTNTSKNKIEDSNFNNYDVLDSEIEFNHNQKELTFLGLILLKNKLNKDTAEVFHNLHRMGCNLRISTGDHPITSISVASQCEIIKNQKDVFLCDIKEKENLKHLKM